MSIVLLGLLVAYSFIQIVGIGIAIWVKVAYKENFITLPNNDIILTIIFVLAFPIVYLIFGICILTKKIYNKIKKKQ